jgi:hypothetical protein
MSATWHSRFAVNLPSHCSRPQRKLLSFFLRLEGVRLLTPRSEEQHFLCHSTEEVSILRVVRKSLGV